MSQPKQNPTKGSFLLSEPFLKDPNFKRTVVLLTEHNQEHTIGFILNKPMEFRLNEISEDFVGFDVPVYRGGPLEPNSLHYIHRVKELASGADEIANGVYWGGDTETLKLLILSEKILPSDIRFFIGYSGWGPKQLDNEMKSKTWIISPSWPKFTFSHNSQSLWRDILNAMGGKFRLMANYPEDPSLN